MAYRRIRPDTPTSGLCEGPREHREGSRYPQAIHRARLHFGQDQVAAAMIYMAFVLWPLADVKLAPPIR